MDIDRNAPAIASGKIEIAADRLAVWDRLTNFGGWPEWQPRVRSVDFDGEVAPGAVFRWKPGPTTITSTVTEVDPPSEVGWTGTTLGIQAVHVWRLAPSGGGTSVTTEESWDGWLVRALKGPMAKSLQKEIDAALGHLKAAVEGDAT